MSWIRRLLGIIIILVSLIAVGISIAGTLFAHDLVDALAGGFGEVAVLASDTIVASEDTLVLLKDTVDEVTVSLDTVEKSALDVAATLDDTQPLLEQVSVIVAETVPESIDALDQASPNLIQIAGAIDDTLVLLSDFTIKETIPIVNYELEFDLSVIDYDPVAPFDESVQQVTTSFEGVPEQMREMATQIDTASENLDIIGDDIVAISGNIDSINAQVAEVPAQIDEFISILNRVNDDVGGIEGNLNAQLETVKLGITVFMIWVGLLQIAPLTVGWWMLTGGRDADWLEDAAKKSA